MLRLTAEGLTAEQIGTFLDLTPTTVHVHLFRVRQKLGAQTNPHAVLIAAWHHAHLLAGAVAKHGTAKAVDAHDEYETPLCGPCAEHAEIPVRKPSSPYRRLTPVGERLKRGEDVACGTIQAARRHLRNKERLDDLTCGCQEAYQEWWREYRRLRPSA